MSFDPASLIPAAFLRCHVGGGVSPAMRDALAKAEASIVATCPDWDAIFKRVRSVGGYRPHGGKHSLGIAVDLDYAANPYIATRTGKVYGGELAGATLTGTREAAVAVCDRAMVYAHGPGAFADLAARRPGESTAACWDRVYAASEALRVYLGTCWRTTDALVHRPPVAHVETAPLATIEAEAGDELVPEDAAHTALAMHGSLDPEGDRVRILRDHEIVRVPTVIGTPSLVPRVTRNLARGFLSIPREVAVALCDVAGMRWGAVDFGAAESGDVMHWDSPGTRHP